MAAAVDVVALVAGIVSSCCCLVRTLDESLSCNDLVENDLQSKRLALEYFKIFGSLIRDMKTPE